MNYIIFDLEWNQACEDNIKKYENLPFEIIEIGAIKLNSKKEIIDEFTVVIKPEIYKELHYITEQLIQIHKEDLDRGISFVDACTKFLEWCGKDYLFCTWGNLDLIELQRNINFYKMPPLANKPFKFLDIQKLFSISYEDSKKRRTLEFAVDFLEIEKDREFHRAVSDAYYTTKVFQQFKRKDIEEYFSFDVYHIPAQRKDEIKHVFPNYMKYISSGFEDKNVALENREVISTRCYLCRKNIKRKIKWFSSNGKTYYSLSYCDIHGFVKGKFRLKKAENNLLFAIKTLKIISNEEAEMLIRKYELVKKQKRKSK